MPQEEGKNKNSERSPLLCSGAEAAAGVSEPPDSRGAAAPGWTRAHAAHRSPPKAPQGLSVQPGASSSRGAPLGWLQAVGVSLLLFFDDPRHPTLSRHPEGEAEGRPHNPRQSLKKRLPVEVSVSFLRGQVKGHEATA